MIGLALSGGGSRAIAFHLGCLRALNDLDLLNKIKVISTISGGSVIGAYYAYTPEKSFEEFENDIISILKTGFEEALIIELLKPNHLLASLESIFLNFVLGLSSRQYRSRTDVFKSVIEKRLFSSLALNSTRRDNVDIVIGACELRTGSAFRFGNQFSGNWRLGNVLNDIDVATAVTASAAYPIFLPSLDRRWNFKKNDRENSVRVLLTDGGVYDNLGLQALEPNRNPEFSLHTFSCDYLIVCNAGHGQESGELLPLSYFKRVSKSFSTIHRRVQDSAMHNLHHLKTTGLIKGFVMPYLGQVDERLPWRPGDFVLRDDVISYPTNFSRMTDENISKLSNRGEQLTKILVSHYLPEIL